MLLTGGILMTVFLLWFAANSQQTARPVARALLQGLALSLTQAIENLAARDPSFKTLTDFRYRDIAYFALIDRSGRVRFHQNPELAGEIVADDRYLPAFSAAAPVENRIRLGTGEEVYECHLPLHLPGETLVLRLVLHTWQADQVINRARTGATILLTVTASAWVLGFLEEVLFAGAAMAEARRLIGNVADTPASVLISGESGTGKELAARMIHLASQRREAAFVAINCAAIPENLMESELFGHEKGAFTGATQARPGKFELAAGATTVHESGVGDINMTTGWTLLADGERTPKVRPTLYLKVPSGDLDRGLGTGTGFSVSKWLGNVQLFGEGAYIFQNSKSDYPGRDYVSYLGGAGIQATERLFVSALAKGSSSRSDGAEAQAEGRLKVSFMQSRRMSWEIYGAAGFTDASPDFGGGMMLTYQF